MLNSDADTSLAVRAAWLHYAGGLTQSEVARRLGLNNVKAHRLITKANQDGLIKVFIDGDIAECIALEQQICSVHHLAYCQVVPDFDHADLPLKALGIAGAQFLMREIDSDNKNNSDPIIGVGHGRTLSSCINYLPSRPHSNVKFVSLLGGLNRNFAASPHDVIHRLAQRTNTQAFVMPVPFFANNRKDRETLLAQRGVNEACELARRARLKIVGIGTMLPETSLVATGLVEPAEIKAAENAGAAGEMLGHFFSTDGQHVTTELSLRNTALPVSELKGDRIVAVAGGKYKTDAIRSVLNSRLLSGLVTDERTARSLVS